jgi:hypothetical protein
MKRLLLLLALSLPILAKAQTTALPLPTDGSTWVHFDPWLDNPSTYGHQYVEEDTLNGVKNVNESIVPAPNCNKDWVGNVIGVYYSQEGNKWYFGQNGSNGGILFFDWDFQVGDTLTTFFTGYSEVCWVSSIDTVIYADGIPRRRFHLANENGVVIFPYLNGIDNFEVMFIEGIGTNIMGLNNSDSIESLPLLVCFYDNNGTLIYTNDWSGNYINAPVNCCPVISVEETTSKSFKLFPSPATDQTSLQFESAHIPQIVQIFNATGQLVHTENVLGRLQMQVNVSEYAKGIYTVRGRFENGEEVSEKLVVE